MSAKERYIVGVDLGGTNIVAGAMPIDGSREIAMHTTPTLADTGAEAADAGGSGAGVSTEGAGAGAPGAEVPVAGVPAARRPEAEPFVPPQASASQVAPPRRVP